MKKIRKEFKTMSDVTSFLKTIEASQGVRREIEKIVKNIEKTSGYPHAEIINHEHFGNTYKKEFYFSDIHLTPNSFNEIFNANVRVKTESVKLIVLINYFKYDYNYEGNETDESAILKMAYTD